MNEQSQASLSNVIAAALLGLAGSRSQAGTSFLDDETVTMRVKKAIYNEALAQGDENRRRDAGTAMVGPYRYGCEVEKPNARRPPRWRPGPKAVKK